MNLRGVTCALLILSSCLAATADADTPASGQEEGALFTLWPLIDYRENPREKTTRLSLLGPILSFEQNGDDHTFAFRPLYYKQSNEKEERSASTYLYPLASSENTPEVSRTEFLHLLQKDTFRKDEPVAAENKSMFFPFYISGESAKYGPYTSVFPIYGDIYERFGKDEYHYVLFPIYGRTVKKGTTNYNVLWPFFSVTKGENESGYRFWPLYGTSAKEGVYSRTFALWPIYLNEKKGLDTDNPSTRFNIFPLYCSFESAQAESVTWLWPFFGHSEDRKAKEEEWDFLWPLWLTVRGEKRTITKFLPFYSSEQSPDSSKNWYLWPLYRSDSFQSEFYRQERQRLLFFLYTDRQESWAVDDRSRRRTALWPLFLYTRDAEDSMKLTLPALVEPILDKEGIEKSWAPLWRIYSHQWSSRGESSLSIFWNLYWHEKSPDRLDWELFPFVSYGSAPLTTELNILKGLVKYRSNSDNSNLSLFWLPLDIKLGVNNPAQTKGESKP